jgi:hypothetical protein
VQVGEAYGYNYKYAVVVILTLSVSLNFLFKTDFIWHKHFHNKLPARGFVQNGIYETNSLVKVS